MVQHNYFTKSHERVTSTNRKQQQTNQKNKMLETLATQSERRRNLERRKNICINKRTLNWENIHVSGVRADSRNLRKYYSEADMNRRTIYRYRDEDEGWEIEE